MSDNIKYCNFCCNSRVEPELDDNNDFSSFSIGRSAPLSRLMLSSCCGKPVRFEVEYWSKDHEQWFECGCYYPKYCPECGRKLDEYEVE